MSLIVEQLGGNPWQLDSHMYFFATLAVLAAYCDWRVVLMAATAIALHHLVLNFLLLGIVLTANVSAAVAASLRQAGFLVNPIQPDVIRLAPPLILTTEQADAFLAALPTILDGVA